MISRRRFLASAAAAGGTGRPNVVLIVTDQQWSGALSAAGNPHVRTPNLDGLAREGTRFANSWCTSPVCSPARSSLITGCMPHKTGVVFNGDTLNPGVPTLAEMFRDAGYETAWVGKWHLPEGAPRTGRQRGFDFLPFPIADRRQLAYGEFLDPPVADAAAAFLRQKRDRPFFLGVSFLNPHDICYWIVDKLPHGDISEGDLPPLPPNFAVSRPEPEFISRCRQRTYYGEENVATKEWDDLHWRRYLRTYYRMTERVDRQIGRVLEALREAALDDDTIVVFTADHGEGMAAHHWVVKLMLFQETLSVPLIFRWKPRIAAGAVDRATLASGMDVLPTLCDLAGVRPLQKMHGTPLLRSPRRDSVYAQLAPDTKDRKFQGRAVRTDRFKYIRFSEGTYSEMLFDLREDPGEMRDLASSPRHRAERDRHRVLLQQWMDTTGDGFRVI